MVPVSPLDLLPARRQNGYAHSQDKHHPAHGRGTLLCHMPGGAVLLDGLARLEPAQQWDEYLPQDGSHPKGHDEAEDECHDQNLFLF